MADFGLDLSGLEEAVQAVQDIIEGGQFADVALPALQDTGEFILSQTVDKFYPEEQAPPWVDVGMPVSDKQRRWWFWALKSGKVRAEYKRTGELGKSLAFEVDNQGDVFTIEVGVNWEDASAVIGEEDDQSPLHRGRWIPLQTIIDDNAEDIGDFYVQQLAVAIEKHLAGLDS